MARPAAVARLQTVNPASDREEAATPEFGRQVERVDEGQLELGLDPV